MSVFKFHITLSGAISASASIADNKYNKPRFVAMQFDDGQYEGFVNLLKIWIDNGYTYTDGCSNVKNYTADVGTTIDTGDAAHSLDMMNVINSGGDISNHSAFHRQGDQQEQVDIMNAQVFEAIDYKMASLIVPVNYTGFANAAYLSGMRGATSENDVFDQFNSERHHKTIASTPILNFDCFIRTLKDDFENPATIDAVKFEIAMLFNDLERNFFILASHSALETQAKKDGIKEIFDYLYNLSNDTVLMCTVREFLDYRTIRNANLTQNLLGNVLTVNIDTSGLTGLISWEDVCLNIVTDGTILGVTTEGFTSSSFNPSTGLINGFKRRINWLDVPPYEIWVKHGKFSV